MAIIFTFTVLAVLSGCDDRFTEADRGQCIKVVGIHYKLLWGEHRTKHLMLEDGRTIPWDNGVAFNAEKSCVTIR